MGVLIFPDWQKPCEDALWESDPEKLFQRVIVAETAIFHRIHGLTSTPGNIELQAGVEALLLQLECTVRRDLFILGDRGPGSRHMLSPTPHPSLLHDAQVV